MEEISSGRELWGTGPLVGAFGRDGAKESKRYDEDFDVGRWDDQTYCGWQNKEPL
jgi:hypothetical protein